MKRKFILPILHPRMRTVKETQDILSLGTLRKWKCLLNLNLFLIDFLHHGQSPIF